LNANYNLDDSKSVVQSPNKCRHYYAMIGLGINSTIYAVAPDINFYFTGRPTGSNYNLDDSKSVVQSPNKCRHYYTMIGLGINSTIYAPNINFISLVGLLVAN